MLVENEGEAGIVQVDRERCSISVDSRYFIEMVKVAREAIRALRQDLDEWERQCNNICDQAVPELVAEAHEVLRAEKIVSRPGGEVASLHPEENTV